MKKFYASFSKVVLLSFSLLLIATPNLFCNLLNTDSEKFPVLQNIDLTFDFPEQIKAGEKFTFSVNLKDPQPLLKPGIITVQFTDGFTPIYKQIEGVQYDIKSNSALFSWSRLTDGNLFFLSFLVKTAENLNGVYPVRIVYNDNGNEIKKNAGLYVVGKPKTSDNFQELEERFSPISIKLIYPEEVLLNSDYDLIIEIAKGKNTGGAEINVRMPPAGNILIEDSILYSYGRNSGKLQIKIPNMPPSPTFAISAKVQNNSIKKAVYPVSASVIFDNQTRARYSDYIYITDQITRSEFTAQTSHEDVAEDYADLEDTFSELDRLLNEWTTSTTGKNPNQKSKPPKEEVIVETDQKTVLSETEENRPIQLQQKTPTNGQKNDFPKTIFFTVQIAASKVPMPKLGRFLRSMQILVPSKEDYDNAYYRYIVGEFPNIEQAKDLRLKLIEKGFSDAFIVKYENGVRATPKE
jgi:hypothetical protein